MERFSKEEIIAYAKNIVKVAGEYAWYRPAKAEAMLVQLVEEMEENARKHSLGSTDFVLVYDAVFEDRRQE